MRIVVVGVKEGEEVSDITFGKEYEVNQDVGGYFFVDDAGDENDLSSPHWNGIFYIANDWEEK